MEGSLVILRMLICFNDSVYSDGYIIVKGSYFNVFSSKNNIFFKYDFQKNREIATFIDKR